MTNGVFFISHNRRIFKWEKYIGGKSIIRYGDSKYDSGAPLVVSLLDYKAHEGAMTIWFIFIFTLNE